MKFENGLDRDLNRVLGTGSALNRGSVGRFEVVFKTIVEYLFDDTSSSRAGAVELKSKTGAILNIRIWSRKNSSDFNSDSNCYERNSLKLEPKLIYVQLIWLMIDSIEIKCLS